MDVSQKKKKKKNCGMDKNTNYVVDGLICLNAHERKKRRSD